MKAKGLFTFLALGVLFHTGVQAKESLLTAHIGADGSILRQWPKWIESVKYEKHINYYSEYKLALNPRIVHLDPGFCSVSPIDNSSYEHLLHGQAKVIGKPAVSQVTVITQLVDLKGNSDDNSLEFQVMCTQ
ncbi:hypothetical protein [Pseudomonas fluorescens]|uniref:hypothetical protein n=1 Tax=Pseudomonas fluorescens TaxID=294 RepID=UPI001780F4B6|nr:hypothetical protein [Pseudomonas fluorescens]